MKTVCRMAGLLACPRVPTAFSALSRTNGTPPCSGGSGTFRDGTHSSGSAQGSHLIPF